MKSLCLILMTLLAFTANADSEIYKWVDEQGNVHYSDYPPPATREAEVVEATPGPSEDEIERAQQELDTLLAKQEESSALREQESLERQRQKAKAMEVAVEKKRVCILAQQNLHALLMRRPVYYIDEKGERVYLDDQTHKAEIERMGELIEENCVEPSAR